MVVDQSRSPPPTPARLLGLSQALSDCGVAPDGVRDLAFVGIGAPDWLFDFPSVRAIHGWAFLHDDASRLRRHPASCRVGKCAFEVAPLLSPPPMPAHAFDLVIAVEALDGTDEDVEMLGVIERSLRPGAHAVFIEQARDAGVAASTPSVLARLGWASLLVREVPVAHLCGPRHRVSRSPSDQDLAEIVLGVPLAPNRPVAHHGPARLVIARPCPRRGE